MSSHSEPFSILLVNYRTLRLTSLCMGLLKKHLDVQMNDIVVVDNGSDDESLDYLRSLDWITLVERTQSKGAPAFISHGEALDEGLKHVKTSRVCLLHTDTFIHDPKVFDLLHSALDGSQVAAAGAKYQRHRRIHKRAFRIVKKASRYYTRKLLIGLRLSASEPKPYRDPYLKSFCCMWDVDLIRKTGLKFSTGSKNPGYEMQDTLQNEGFRFIDVGTAAMFRYLSHVQSGTVVEINRSILNKRRHSDYERIVRETISAI